MVLEAKNICAEQNLTFFSPDRWQDIENGHGYICSFCKIGENIVYTTGGPDARLFDSDQFFDLLDQFIKETAIQFPYVLIRDISYSSGRPTAAARKKQKEYLYQQKDILCGVIFASNNFLIKSLLSLAASQYQDLLELKVVDSTKKSIDEAVRILENNPDSNPPPISDKAFSTLVFDPGWQYKNQETGFLYSNGVIHGRIWFSGSSGNASDKDLDQMVPCLEKVIIDAGFADKRYIRIVDYANVEPDSFSNREKYAQVVRGLHIKFNATAEITYICNADEFSRASLALFAKFVNQKMVFLDSVDEAFEAAKTFRHQSEQEETVTIKRSDVQKLMEMQGDFLFEKDFSQTRLFPPGHVLNTVVEAMNIIRSDIHEMQAREAEQRKKLEEMNTELEIQTQKANQMAVEAELSNIAKSEFLANMSHEIRTPMNGIIGMGELLMGTELDEEQKRYARIINSSGEALLALINDILDYSKIEAGKMELEVLDFDLRNTLEDIAQMLAVKVRDTQVELILIIDPQIPSLLCGDPGRLRQVLINITGNAIKFTRQGEVTISAELLNETQENAQIRFEVEDTGIGIPENKQASLFLPFTQMDGSITRKYGGTGLGLSISKRIITMMDGQIGVNSKEGEGANFWFTIEFNKQKDQAKAVETIPVELENKRLLIVDDNSVNCELLEALMGLWKISCRKAMDGKKALELMAEAAEQNQPFDAAILDMQMPEMDGAELGRRIKSNPQYRTTHLIMLTSMGQRGDCAKMSEIGFSAYLNKPVRKTELKDCLLLTLSGRPDDDKGKNRSIITRHTISDRKKQLKKILVVDDNPTNQAVARMMLKKLGYPCQVAEDGRKALDALNEGHWDLVLMDCQMPVLDGYQATRHLRRKEKNEQQKHLPIIAMTAQAMKGDRQKCLEAGMDDYLPKPIKPDMLNEKLEKWLSSDLYFDKSDPVDTQSDAMDF